MTTNALDPRMALLTAIFNMKKGNMGELNQLAQETKDSNDLLDSIRKIEDMLRKAKSDKMITRGELDDIRAAANAANEKGAQIDIESFITAITGGPGNQSKMADDDQNGAPTGGRMDTDGPDRGDYVWANANSEHQHHKDNATQLDNIAEGLKSAKDAEKGRAANRELDMQRAVQDSSSLDQLYSNMSKTFHGTDMAIIGNTRA